FSKELSINVSTYVNCVRIQKAIDLMAQRPDYPLTDVAIDVGFSSLQYFSRVFKEQIELPPSKYMEMYRKDR
ncbi:MAG: helix-turn-helix domain-containing protein, partial [Oscillospiraceae bacterium]